MRNLWRGFEKAVDILAGVMGALGAILVLYCMLFGVTDVFLRYVLDSASMWISPTLQAGMVLMACVGGVYALNHRSFVRLDLIYAGFSAKTQAAWNLITSVFTFLFLWALIWVGWDAAMLSVMLNERTPTVIPIPIYPIKIFIPIAAVFVLLVVIRQLGNDVAVLAGRR